VAAACLVLVLPISAGASSSESVTSSLRATSSVSATPGGEAAARSQLVTQVIQDCSTYRVRPRFNIVVSCADGNIYLSGMTWFSWHHKNATGHGNLWLNDCDPSCAAGHMHRYPVHAHLSHAYLDRQHRVFHRAHLRFTGRKPPLPSYYHDLQLPGHPE
jgi:hypothetical protein